MKKIIYLIILCIICSLFACSNKKNEYFDPWDNLEVAGIGDEVF